MSCGRAFPGTASCEDSGVKRCTSGDDQLRHQHPRLCDCFGSRREGAAGTRPHRPCNANRMDHLIASNPCGVRQCGDPQGRNTDRGHPKDDRCLACGDLAAALEAALLAMDAYEILAYLRKLAK